MESIPYLYVEYVGGPYDGWREMFTPLNLNELDEIFAEAEQDPLFGSEFANAPGPLSDMLMITKFNDTKYFYAFKSKWRTNDGRYLRVEHIKGNDELEGLDGDEEAQPA